MVNTRVPWMEGKSLLDVCLGGLQGSGPETTCGIKVRDGMITIRGEF